MKKLSIILSAFLLMFTLTTFGNNYTIINETPQEVLASFENDFGEAVEITWKQKGDVYFANFELNECTFEAAYKANGVLVATSKELDRDEIPMAVLMGIEDRFEGFEIAGNPKEIFYENSTRYYLRIHDEDEILKLKCSPNGSIVIEERTDKL